MSKRPTRRRSVTCSIRVGKHSAHVTIGRDKAGRPLEVFIDGSWKDGSMLRELLHAVAILLSMSWQAGQDPTASVRVLMDASDESAGRGHDHPAIEGKQCPSLLDGIARVILAELSAQADQTQPGAAGAAPGAEKPLVGIADQILYTGDLGVFETLRDGTVVVKYHPPNRTWLKTHGHCAGIVRCRVVEAGQQVQLQDGDVWLAGYPRP